jgi:hypothetical protein
MHVPGYVKLSVFTAEAYLVSTAVRDLLAPGTPLPVVGDAELVKGLWGDVSSVTLESRRMLAQEQFWGACLLALALVKLVTIFTNPEGTFLRRNLMLAIGLADVGVWAVLQQHSQVLSDGYGVSLLPFKCALLLEGSALLLDAVLRPRRVKH